MIRRRPEEVIETLTAESKVDIDRLGCFVVVDGEPVADFSHGWHRQAEMEEYADMLCRHVKHLRFANPETKR